MPRLHPNLSELYRQKIDRLHETLNQEDVQSEASEVLRSCHPIMIASKLSSTVT
jgi:hypothetical protein